MASSDDFDQAFGAMERAHPGGLIVLYGPLRGNDLPRIVEFANRLGIPTVFEAAHAAGGGGLMEFGPSIADAARPAGRYIDRIVKEPTRFELVINLKVARTLGLTIPPALLGRADQIIE